MTYLIAFVGGVLSFISPCVLPLIPVYFGIITGLNLQEASYQKGRVFLSSFLFVLGFSLSFSLLGASASAVGNIFRNYRTLFSIFAGVIILILGLHLMGIFKIPFLLTEKRIDVPKKLAAGSLALAFVSGFLFAFGWTPCIGPILGGILTLAASHGSVTQGVFLLIIYSFGLGIPFLIASLFIAKFVELSKRLKKFVRAVEISSGLLLIFISVLLLTGKMTKISSILAWFSLEKIANIKLNKISSSSSVMESTPLLEEILSSKAINNIEIERKDFILINFWAPWCPPCRTEIPLFVEATSSVTNLQVVGIAYKSSEAEIQKFLDKIKVNYPIILDKNFSDKLKITGLPETLIYYKNSLVKRIVGVVEEGEIQQIVKE